MRTVNTTRVTFRFVTPNGEAFFAKFSMMAGPVRIQVQIDGEAAKGQRLTLFIDKAERCGLSFKDMESSTVCPTFVCTTNERGESTPFYLAHNSYVLTPTGTIYAQIGDRDAFGLQIQILRDIAPRDIEEIIPASDGREPVLETPTVVVALPSPTRCGGD